MTNRLKHIQPRIAQNVTAKVVTLDIERIPGRAKVYHHGVTSYGDFWDLNGWKHWLGRRIHADDVLEWPRTICAAWKFYDEDEVHFAAEWEVGGYAGFMQRVWDVLDTADALVGHNSRGFDGPHLLTGFAELGMPAPSPYKDIDTLVIARRAFKAESNTLDALAKRLGVDAKTDKYSATVAKAAANGDKGAQEQIAEYNKGDIIASEALFDRLRPYARNLPHLGMWSDDPLACPACGATMQQTGRTVHALVQAYEGYQCPSCGAHARGTTKLKQPTATRGIA